MSEKTWVAIGCSTTPDYAFLLPITCLLWREVVGYEPLVMLAAFEPHDNGVATGLAWGVVSHARVVNEALFNLGFNRHSVGAALKDKADFGEALADPSLFYSMATLAQNSRQHAAVLDHIADTDWVMPGDADLWPLKRDFYHQHEGTKHKAVCYYSNGDHFASKREVLERASQGLGSQTIPTCHVTMRAADWRAIYGLTPGEPIAGAVKRSLDSWLPGRVEVPGRDMGMHVWMSDQQLMTEALCQQFWFPERALMVERRGHPPVDRLDRCHPRDWFGVYEQERWTDAHVFREPWMADHWILLIKIIDALLPQHSQWARTYRDEFVKALEAK